MPSDGRPGGPDGGSKVGPLCGAFEVPDVEKCLFYAVVRGGGRGGAGDPPPENDIVTLRP